MKAEACAKINLTLDVLGRREDGYHDLRMVMQSVSLADTLTLTFGAGEGVTARTNLGYLPSDRRNLACAAAEVFAQAAGVSVDGLEIFLEKRIPVCAGTAGGSSDAAAVLRALNEHFETGFSRETLARLGEQVGSDVPYCVMGGTALAEGRGEILTPLPPMPPCFLVLCKPAFPISTPELFRAVDGVKLRCHPDTEGMLHALEAGELAEVARRMYNVFEDVLPAPRAGEIRAIRNALLSAGALGACMSGTGPTVFGVFETEEPAKRAWKQLKSRYEETFLCRPV